MNGREEGRNNVFKVVEGGYKNSMSHQIKHDSKFHNLYFNWIRFPWTGYAAYMTLNIT